MGKNAHVKNKKSIKLVCDNNQPFSRLNWLWCMDIFRCKSYLEINEKTAKPWNWFITKGLPITCSFYLPFKASFEEKWVIISEVLVGSQAVTIVSDSVLWLEGYPPSSKCVIFLTSTIFFFFNDKSPNLTRFETTQMLKAIGPWNFLGSVIRINVCLVWLIQ